uniref:Uncharacterized protein n=1 Tax=Anguilla anguilla TaxID=7936 RepID=A0A0E9QA51_ANGAN
MLNQINIQVSLFCTNKINSTATNGKAKGWMTVGNRGSIIAQENMRH